MIGDSVVTADGNAAKNWLTGSWARVLLLIPMTSNIKVNGFGLLQSAPGSYKRGTRRDVTG